MYAKLTWMQLIAAKATISAILRRPEAHCVDPFDTARIERLVAEYEAISKEMARRRRVCKG